MKRINLIAVMILAALMLLTVTPVHAATTWYVLGWNGNDANSCTTPLAPCRTINAAIAKALPGDTIEIDAGLFMNPGAPEVVRVTKDLTLLGGWDNNFGQVINYTILNGEHQRRGLSVAPGVTVMIDHFALVQGFAADGGGAYIQGTFHGSNMIVWDNRALDGAGFYIDNADLAAQMGISNTAIVGNQYYAKGGGIFINDGTLYTANLTVSDNVSINSVDEEHGTPPTFGGGVYLYHGYFWSSHSTFAQNTRYDGQSFTKLGADLANGFNYGQIQIANVLISGGCTGFISFSTHDLERGNTCQLIGSGDLVNVNPQILPLNLNGAATLTHALAQASPAIDAADSVYCGSSSDQRGVPRPQGNGCDIGAFERKADDPQGSVIGGCQTPDGICPPDSRTLLQGILGPGVVQVLEGGVESYAASGEIDARQGKPLMHKLENAAESLASGSTDDAIGQLNAFIHQVEAQRGKKISRIAADNLIEQAQALIAFLSEPWPDCVSVTAGEDGQELCTSRPLE